MLQCPIADMREQRTSPERGTRRLDVRVFAELVVRVMRDGGLADYVANSAEV